MHKNFLFLLFTISSYLFAMEEIVATHPLIAAAAANDTLKIADELNQLKRIGASALYNLLECRNTEVALALQKSECFTFEKVTYAALAAAIKNKHTHASLAILFGGPVCLHNNPQFLLHEASKGGWKDQVIGASQKMILEGMVENGAVVTQKNPVTGKTPLETAQENGADYHVCDFLKEAAKKYEEKVKNFKPYFKQYSIPPYADIVSYENVKTLDDECRIEHYKQHSRVDYKPT